ncbi:hypothetical protein ALC53_05660 [Atta colombica]|uniref:Uncharacterized protein n=1 Tax=Atta colombica TaxID=520822 RepID=A0A151I3P5_9HYME|nr:hypothetical protein ALC53_05660 [Atta colombica]
MLEKRCRKNVKYRNTCSNVRIASRNANTLVPREWYMLLSAQGSMIFFASSKSLLKKQKSRNDNENEDKKNEQRNFVYTIILKFHAKFLQNGTPLCSFNLHSSPQESLSKEIDVLGRKFVSRFQRTLTSFTSPRCGGYEMGLRSLTSVGGATKA